MNYEAAQFFNNFKAFIGRKDDICLKYENVKATYLIKTKVDTAGGI